MEKEINLTELMLRIRQKIYQSAHQDIIEILENRYEEGLKEYGRLVAKLNEICG